MRTVRFGCDAAFRSYALLQLRRGGKWQRISLAFAEALVRQKWARAVC
jgi:hypothetical protein